jgi:sulfofructose kinase
VLHLDGNYLNCAIQAAKVAKENGVKVSLDAGGLYKDIDKLIPYVDILIPSAEFALGLTGKTQIGAAMSALSEKYAPEILVVTDGSNGGYYWQNGQAVHYDSVKVKAVDTNGAGDTFHGAFIAAYCEGKNVKDCCVYASKVAAYKCMHTGARTYELSKEIADKL